MKKLLVILLNVGLFLFFTSCENRQTAVKEEANLPTKAETVANEVKPVAKDTAPKVFAAFSFDETEYDFGPIDHGDVVEHVFAFTNTGKAPLVITDIRTTCGCTTPEYTKKPVAPGETGEVKVRFNSRGKSGVINKKVTIYANTEEGVSFLNIKTVINADEEIKGPYKNQPPA